MECTPVKGNLLPTPCEAARAALDYAEIFRRIQVEWLVYFGIVKSDDNESSEPPRDRRTER
jgi:hypothetical protein